MKTKSSARRRIVLADDHRATLRAVESFLQSDYNVICAVSDGQSLIEAIENLSPDVVVIDIAMPRMTGLQAARRLRDLGLKTKVVFLTLQENPEFLYAAMAAGALGYVLKYRLNFDLPLAIESALAGQRFVSPPLADLDF